MSDNRRAASVRRAVRYQPAGVLPQVLRVTRLPQLAARFPVVARGVRALPAHPAKH